MRNPGELIMPFYWRKEKIQKHLSSTELLKRLPMI
jgi:hypothetical protein